MKYRETENTELKKSTSELKEAVISICAILNKHGRGTLYFGLKNDGAVIGQQVGNNTLRDISRAISEHIEPKVYPNVCQVRINNKPCIKVIFDGKDEPYFAFGRSYMRVADEDRQISARELEHLIIKKHKGKLHWDREVCPQARLSDISTKKIKAFLKIAGLKYTTTFSALSKLKLLSGKKLLNTAVILFAKRPQGFFPNAKLRCAVFARTDTAFIIDRKEFEGDIFHLIEKAQDYILENIHIGMRVEGLRRVDVPEIDREAFREAIINAFCHRDYREYDSVNIAVFKDRLEIRNPGLLYGDLTIKRITTEMVSERRNELIAELFHRIHIIEKWGRGIRLILSKEPETNFKEVGRHFIVVFKRKYIKEKTVKRKTTEQVAEKAAKESSQKRLAESAEKVRRKCGESAEKVLAAITADLHIKTREISNKTQLAQRTVEKAIALLKKEGILKRVGPDKGGYWKIIKKSRG